MIKMRSRHADPRNATARSTMRQRHALLDPFESLSRQALEALWYIDRNLAIRTAAAEQNFTARSSLAIALFELQQDEG